MQQCQFTGDGVSGHVSASEILVLASNAGAGGMAPPTSTGISDRLKYVQEHSSEYGAPTFCVLLTRSRNGTYDCVSVLPQHYYVAGIPAKHCVGATVGIGVGLDVGLIDGLWEGAAVGAREGRSVGAWVRSFVGDPQFPKVPVGPERPQNYNMSHV